MNDFINEHYTEISETSQKNKITPVYGKNPIHNVGYEYTNLDLKSMSSDQIMEFGKNIIRDNVILLRNQDLDNPDDIYRVATSIGRVMPAKQFYNVETHPGLGRVTNERDSDGKKIGIFADKELDWHSNGNNRETGKECCVILYCVKPGLNSITSFADTRRAYQELPGDIKEIVDDIDCVFQFKNNTFYNLDENDQELEFFDNRHLYPEGLVKPLVYTHPYSSEKGLYFTFHSITKMWRRNGKPLDENWLRSYLMNHVFQEKYIYHHSDWRNGDIIFMDQFHSIHKRNEVQGDRFLWRITIDYRKSIRRVIS
jgi:alpha-ketoglutarate-dependent taurine dioxygenase